MYHIEIMQINIGDEIIITVDGMEQQGKMISLSDDEGEHTVHVASAVLILN